MAKTLFKKSDGSIHFGRNAPEGFTAATADDVKKNLSKLGKMKLWRCHICGDLHIGVNYPKECPTCGNIDSYAEINEKELRATLGI